MLRLLISSFNNASINALSEQSLHDLHQSFELSLLLINLWLQRFEAPLEFVIFFLFFLQGIDLAPKPEHAGLPAGHSDRWIVSTR